MSQGQAQQLQYNLNSHLLNIWYLRAWWDSSVSMKAMHKFWTDYISSLSQRMVRLLRHLILTWQVILWNQDRHSKVWIYQMGTPLLDGSRRGQILWISTIRGSLSSFLMVCRVKVSNLIQWELAQNDQLISLGLSGAYDTSTTRSLNRFNGSTMHVIVISIWHLQPFQFKFWWVIN